MGMFNTADTMIPPPATRSSASRRPASSGVGLSSAGALLVFWLIARPDHQIWPSAE